MAKDKLHLDNVEILLVEPDLNMRHSIRNILHDNGFRNIRLGANLHDVKEEFVQNMPDLLISESTLADGDFCDFVAGLRHGEYGTNPFLPIIAMAWSPTQDTVRRVIQTGSDDLLSKPLSAGQLLNRINVLIKMRKPFVVTTDYIGPDRRSRENREKSKIPLIDVPNTLKFKATTGRELEAKNLQAAIDASASNINIQKLQRHAVQIRYLVDRLVPAMQMGEIDETSAMSLDRLLYVTQDTARRLVGTQYEHVSDLCQSLIDVTHRIIGSSHADAKDVNLLRPLSQAIQGGFGQDTEDAAHAITDTVKKI